MGRIFEVRKHAMFARWNRMAKQFARIGKDITIAVRNGGTDPAGFDCSGFVQYVFGQHGMALPRDVRQQFGLGRPIDPAALEPGDLVFFTTVAPGASHVGIAIGGDQFVHAPSTRGVVRVEAISSDYWSTRFIGAKRLE